MRETTIKLAKTFIGVIYYDRQVVYTQRHKTKEGVERELKALHELLPTNNKRYAESTKDTETCAL